MSELAEQSDPNCKLLTKESTHKLMRIFFCKQTQSTDKFLGQMSIYDFLLLVIINLLAVWTCTFCTEQHVMVILVEDVYCTVAH